MTSLKRYFLKTFSTDFSEILLADIKSMLEKVSKVLHLYLPPFLSYRENPEGGQNLPPPPSGAHVKGGSCVGRHWLQAEMILPEEELIGLFNADFDASLRLLV